jgi:hypothetical protein
VSKSLSPEFSIANSDICVVSHDAGGGELLASWVARQKQSCRLLLAGPALRVFERRLGHPLETVSLQQALQECDRFLTGTSWQSDFEWKLIRAARALGKPVVSFLDHWGHYRERFVRDGEECLPNAIWTGDEDAFAIAKDLFPSVPVELVPNPYFEDVRQAVAKFADSNPIRGMPPAKLRILFVCEPLSEHGLQEFGDPMHWGYNEFDALHYFFSHLELLGAPVLSAVIRPHPSERTGKYDAIARELTANIGIPLRVGGDESLLQEIAGCDIIAGCESMAMVVGLIAGRRVVSCVPPNGKACVLPHTEIESMQTLVARYA